MSTQLFSAHLSLSLICFTHTHKHTLSHTEKYKYVYTHTHRPLPSNLSLSVFNLSLGSLPVTGSDLNVIRLLSLTGRFEATGDSTASSRCTNTLSRCMTQSKRHRCHLYTDISANISYSFLPSDCLVEMLALCIKLTQVLC